MSSEREVQPESAIPPSGVGQPENPGLTYAAAGVDIDAGERAVELIKPLVASTAVPGVIGGIGGFGGLFAVPSGYRQPVLVASADGVGTKMAVAHLTGRFDTVGIDLVAMCVDDLVCQGAKPLFMLDYQLLGRLDPERVRDLVAGIAAGCIQAGCAILGGELAEHPGLLSADEIDVSGFAVGIVERDAILDGSGAKAGDRLVGLASPGLRSNGYSLARAVLLEHAALSLDGPAWSGATHSLADELLRPSVVYTPAVLAMIEALDVRAVAHITGGGLAGNLPRTLPSGLDAHVCSSMWTEPRIFEEIRRLGNVSEDEMRKVFNLGLGMVVVVPDGQEREAVSLAAKSGVEASVIGQLVSGDGHIRYMD